MFGLGLSEIAIILLVMIIFVNPRDLPEYVGKLSRIGRRMQEMRESFTQSLRGLAREATAASPESTPQDGARVEGDEGSDHGADSQESGTGTGT